eukprot:9484627-Pyramimonas_sp.AAC.1
MASARRSIGARGKVYRRGDAHRVEVCRFSSSTGAPKERHRETSLQEKWQVAFPIFTRDCSLAFKSAFPMGASRSRKGRLRAWVQDAQGVPKKTPKTRPLLSHPEISLSN